MSPISPEREAAIVARRLLRRFKHDLVNALRNRKTESGSTPT